MLAPMNTSTPERAPTPSYRYYWEDFPVGQVMDFGGTPVTREAVLEFARQFDPQPFHTDEEAAKSSVFGGLCASGWHTCAMAMRIMCDGYLLESASQGSPGIDALRWLKPVFPGDVLRLRMEVLQARPMNSRPHVGLVRSRWEMRNQNEEPVLTMEGWGMFLRRSPPA
jgi:acyl dehydratase